MIYCLIGISGSGKSTVAKNMVKYLNAVIIGRDHLREHLFGYDASTINSYWQREDLSEKENQINKYQDALIRKALDNGQDVILDNTHLKLSYINKLKEYGVPIEFVHIDTDFETALERDAARERTVGEEVLIKQFAELETLKKVFDFKRWEPAELEPIDISNRAGKYNVYVFDLDSTLALNNGTRSPYDWKKVGEDSINEPVAHICRVLSDYGHKIVICSGRDEVCRPETEKWLIDHEIPHHEICMRPKGDMRKDAVVKEEMWRRLVKKYNITAIFDDRKQVIDHARKFGFTVLDVAGNTF